MNKIVKILSVIAVISVIAAIFCISSYASDINFEEEKILTVSYSEASLNGYTGTVNYNSKIQYFHSSSYYAVYNIGRSYTGANLSTRCSFANGTTFQINNGDKFKIPANTTLSEEQVNLLYLITDLTPPPPPPIPPPSIEPTLWENVQDFFDGVLDNGTLIVTWMTATPISLIPLTLYCVIVIIAIFKRFVKG